MRTFQIALREFLATAATKGFIIGAFVVPGIFVSAIPLIVILAMNAAPPKVVGSLDVLDKSGAVINGLREQLSPEKLAERRADEKEQAKQVQSKMTGGMTPGGNDATADAMLEQMLGEVPQLTINALPADTDVEQAKKGLDVPYSNEHPGERLGLIVIDPDAVHKAPDAESYGGYKLFKRPKLDDRVIDQIRDGTRRAVLDARYAAAGETRERLQSLITVNAETREVTESGEERRSSEELTAMLPFAFMILLVMSVMIGGQYLLTTTVEEKSSRVVELLLSAVSPIQLMTGKVLGQMCVGFTLLFIYSGLGIGALAFYKLTDLLSPMNVVFLFVFFVLAYFMIASLLAAVGSAVNEMREAQSLQTPVMLLVMVPYILWMPISRDPNSTLATVLSFIPPVNPFIMMMRITSSDAPPMWQVFASIGVGIIGAYACVWFAAKVFRVGLLMYGKPPNFRTLIKWVRMA